MKYVCDTCGQRIRVTLDSHATYKDADGNWRHRHLDCAPIVRKCCCPACGGSLQAEGWVPYVDVYEEVWEYGVGICLDCQRVWRWYGDGRLEATTMEQEQEANGG